MADIVEPTEERATAAKVRSGKLAQPTPRTLLRAVSRLPRPQAAGTNNGAPLGCSTSHNIQTNRGSCVAPGLETPFYKEFQIGGKSCQNTNTSGLLSPPPALCTETPMTHMYRGVQDSASQAESVSLLRNPGKGMPPTVNAEEKRMAYRGGGVKGWQGNIAALATPSCTYTPNAAAPIHGVTNFNNFVGESPPPTDKILPLSAVAEETSDTPIVVLKNKIAKEEKSLNFKVRFPTDIGAAVRKGVSVAYEVFMGACVLAALVLMISLQLNNKDVIPLQ